MNLSLQSIPPSSNELDPFHRGCITTRALTITKSVEASLSLDLIKIIFDYEGAYEIPFPGIGARFVMSEIEALPLSIRTNGTIITRCNTQSIIVPRSKKIFESRTPKSLISSFTISVDDCGIIGMTLSTYEENIAAINKYFELHKITSTFSMVFGMPRYTISPINASIKKAFEVIAANNILPKRSYAKILAMLEHESSKKIIETTQVDEKERIETKKIDMKIKNLLDELLTTQLAELTLIDS